MPPQHHLQYNHRELQGVWVCQVCTRPTVRPYSDEDAPTCGQREEFFCPVCEDEVMFHYYDRLSSAAMLARIVAKQGICEEKKAAAGRGSNSQQAYTNHSAPTTSAIPATTSMVTRALVDQKERSVNSDTDAIPATTSMTTRAIVQQKAEATRSSMPPSEANAIPATTSMVTRALVSEKERALHHNTAQHSPSAASGYAEAIPATTSMVTRALVDQKERSVNSDTDAIPATTSMTTRAIIEEKERSLQEAMPPPVVSGIVEATVRPSRLPPRESEGLAHLEALLADPKRLDTSQMHSLKSFLSSTLYTLDTLISERSMCLVCLEKPRVVVALPCRHRCLCEGCLSALQQRAPTTGTEDEKKLRCPMCRAKVDQYILPFDN
jgi:hypothetical protein